MQRRALAADVPRRPALARRRAGSRAGRGAQPAALGQARRLRLGAEPPVEARFTFECLTDGEVVAVIVLKSSVHSRAEYSALAAKIIVAAAPGQHLADLQGFAYRHLLPGIRRMPHAPGAT